jgi:hypothetical protein
MSIFYPQKKGCLGYRWLPLLTDSIFAGFAFLDAFLGLLPELDQEKTEQNLEADSDGIKGDTLSGL